MLIGTRDIAVIYISLHNNVVLTLACRYISRNGCGYVENHEISLILQR
jgi:hypothetical protein